MRRKNKGITLIALVVTIVVLLILAGVSISMLTGENGIIRQANTADIENRGASVEEEKNLWKNNQKIDQYTNSETAKTLQELIDDLVRRKKLTEDEKDIILGNSEKGIEATGKVTIGSKTIVFFEKSIIDEIKIGDYVNYTYDEAEKYIISSSDNGGSNFNESGVYQENLEWRVFNIDKLNQRIDLISNKPTSNNIYLGGTVGYSNGVNLLNDICAKQYSNKSLGIEARNINIEDINAKLNEEGIKQRNEYVSHAGVKYGESYTYSGFTNNAYYPAIYAQEIGSNIEGGIAKSEGLGQSESPLERNDSTALVGENGITLTQTYYYLEDATKCFGEKEYELLFSSGSSYWVASRMVTCGFKGTRFINNKWRVGIMLYRLGKK